MIAFLFPGQGSEKPGMGLELAQSDPEARRLLEWVAEETGEDLFRLLRRGGRRLAATEVLQPALTAVCLGVLRRLRQEGIEPSLVAGHSLGEIAAWCAAGGLTPEEALSVASLRGRLMAQAACQHPGGALVWLGEEERVSAILQKGQETGTLALAAHNAPHEWVLSGDEVALRAVSESFALRRLPLSGPWHSPLLAEAVEPFRQHLSRLPTRPLQASLVANCSGEVVRHSSAMADLLAAALTQTIQWVTSLQTLQHQGITDYLVLGPERTLRGLLRKNLPHNIQVYTTETPQQLEQTITTLRRKDRSPKTEKEQKTGDLAQRKTGRAPSGKEGTPR